MTGKELFEIISDIDDNYITEAHGEDILNPVASSSSEGASSSSAKAPVPAAPAKRRKLIRIVLPAAAGIAAIGLAVFGLWKGGIIGGKRDLIEPHSSEIIITADITDTDYTTTMPPTTTTTEDVGQASAQSSESEIILPTGNETNANGDPIVQIDTDTASHVSMDVLATLSSTQTGDASLNTFVLRVDISNNGDHPMYFEDVFTICTKDSDGNLVPVAAFEYSAAAALEFAPDADDLSGRCLAPSESVTITLLIDDAYYPFELGTYTLVTNVRYFDGAIEDAATAEPLESYTIAREFELIPEVYRHASDPES